MFHLRRVHQNKNKDSLESDRLNGAQDPSAVGDDGGYPMRSKRNVPKRNV